VRRQWSAFTNVPGAFPNCALSNRCISCLGCGENRVKGGAGMQGRTILVIIAVAVATLTAAPAGAQDLPNRGSVVAAAPIYLLPDRANQPLRTAAEGTILDLLTREGDWIQVRFRDPEFGPRVGFIESRFLSLTTASDARSLMPTWAKSGSA
jgi:hypothetical protein